MEDYESFQDDWELPEGHPKATIEVLQAYPRTVLESFGGQNSPVLDCFDGRPRPDGQNSQTAVARSAIGVGFFKSEGKTR